MGTEREREGRRGQGEIYRKIGGEGYRERGGDMRTER